MSARVLIAGRFPAGVRVHLFGVADEGVTTHVGGEPVGTRKVDELGVVEFSRGVVAGARYIAFGYVDGRPVEVRCRGLVEGEVAGGLGQAPVAADVLKHADGQVVGGVHRPLRHEADRLADAGDAEDDSDGDDSEGPEVLRGAALADRIAELGIEGTSGMSADEKRAAVAAAESAAVPAGA